MRIRWVCVSEVCRREVEVQVAPADMARKISSPTCACGGAMKRVYTTPTIRKLSQGDVDQLNEARLLQS